MGSCTSVKKTRPVYRTILEQIFTLTRKKTKNKEPAPDEGRVDIEALKAYVKPYMKGLIDHLEANKHKLSESAVYLEGLLETSKTNVAKEHALILCVLSELVTNLSKFRPKNLSDTERVVEGREEPEAEVVDDIKKSRKKKNKMLTFMLKKKKKNKEQEIELENGQGNGIDMQEAEKKLKKSKKKLKKNEKKKKGLHNSNLNEHLSRFERSFFDIIKTILHQDYPQKMILTSFSCETIIAYAKEIKELDSLSNTKFAEIISLLTDNKLFNDEKCLNSKNIETADLLNKSILAVYQLGKKLQLNMFLDYKKSYIFILINLLKIYHNFHTNFKSEIKDNFLDHNEIAPRSEIYKASESNLRDQKKYEIISIDSRLKEDIFLILEVLAETSFHVNDYSMVVNPLFNFFDENSWSIESLQFVMFMRINELARKQSILEHLFMVEKMVEYLTHDKLQLSGVGTHSTESFKNEFLNCSKIQCKIVVFHLLKKIIKRLSNIYMAFIYIEKLMTCFVQNIDETKNQDFCLMFEKTYKQFMKKIETVSKHVFLVILSLSIDCARKSNNPALKSTVLSVLSLIEVSLDIVEVFQGAQSLPEEIITNLLKTGEKIDYRLKAYNLLLILFNRKFTLGETKPRKNELMVPNLSNPEPAEMNLEYLSIKKETWALTLLDIKNCIQRMAVGSDQTTISKYEKGDLSNFCAFLQISKGIIKEVTSRKEFNLSLITVSFLNQTRNRKNYESNKHATAVYIFLWEILHIFCYVEEMANLLHELDQIKHKNSKDLSSLQDKFQGNETLFKNEKERERFMTDLDKAVNKQSTVPEIPQNIIQNIFIKVAQDSAEYQNGNLDLPEFDDYFNFKEKRKQQGNVNAKGLHESQVSQSNLVEDNENIQQKAHNTSRNSLIMTPKNLSIDLKRDTNFEEESELITLDFNGENEKEIVKTIPTNPDNKLLDSSYEDAFKEAQSKKKRRNNLNHLLDLDK